MRRRERLAGYLFVLPDALGLLIFVAAPAALSLGLGFFEVSGFGGYRFVGLANYRRMLGDDIFLHSLRVTATYVALLTPSLYGASLGLALLVRRPSAAGSVLRAIFFLPQVFSVVIVGLVWTFLLLDKIGVAARGLALLGVEAVSFLGDPRWALVSLAAVSVWFQMGLYMLIFLGGLEAIPAEYYDAARMDGAGPFALFRHITLPLLRPTSFFVLLISSAAAVAGYQCFDLVYIMTKGGPADATLVTSYYIFRQAFRFNEFGYASAMASVMVLTLTAVTALLMRLTRGGRFRVD